jgi:uncharacterized protein (TIGR00159 family)
VSWTQAIEGILSQVRWTDVIDVILVTSVVYTGLVWIRQTQAALVATGILILAGVYVAARALELQLMAWIFQGFFALLVVIIVVIFQEELRQLFERLAVWSLRRQGRRVSAAADPTDILVACLTDLARDRVGALVVIPGSQPLERHLQGGIELDGHLTMPLLKSIFDPHSAGHDGAMLIENGKVARFAVHLPLSRDFVQLSAVGTRHAAALGLAELTDAFCIVVSEERGQISVAYNGRLRRLSSPSELGAELEKFRKAGDKAGWRANARQLLRENWVEKLASVVLVSGLWFVLVPGARPKLLTMEVPVHVVNLPPSYLLDATRPSHVEVVLAGPARAFYLLDSARIAAYVDATPAQLGRRTFELTSQNIERPSDMTVELIRPDKVKLELHKENGGSPPAR